MKTVVLIGGGFAGLRMACLLRKEGYRPVIIERSAVLGGMVQSFRRVVGAETYVFDYGPHLFFDDYEPEYRQLIGADLLHLVDRFQMWAAGSMLSYPVRLNEAFRHLGLGGLAASALDMAWMRLKRAEDDDLETFMVRRFGRRIFHTFYAPYIEKCTGIPVGATSVAWAQERTNVTGRSLTANLLNKVRQKISRNVRESLSRHNDPTAAAIRAWYPRRGSGQICDAMAATLTAEDVLLNTTPLAVEVDGDSVTGVILQQDGRERRISGDYYVSTIPLTDLVSLLRPAPDRGVAEAAASLRFRGLRLINFVLKGERALRSLEIFSMDPNHVFKRVYEPKAMSAALAPPGTTSLCLEVCVTEGDGLANMPEEELFRRCLAGLRSMGIGIPDSSLLDAFVVWLPHAYPIYHRGFEADRNRLLSFVEGMRNLATSGRQGLFRYHALTNEIMAMARDVVRLLVEHKGQKIAFQGPDRWGRNFF